MRYPAYLNLNKKELNQRVKKAYQLLKKCCVCPRKCQVERLKNEKGFCQLGEKPIVSSYHPHFGEESCLVGHHGSGTIFFTRCNLSCVFCQNYEISQLGYGEEVSLERLAEMMLELQNLGCHNINLVTPTSQVPQILASLPQAIASGLKIPLVYNSNGYDSVETLKLLDGIVDIYMPDAKYSDNEIALKYSTALHPHTKRGQGAKINEVSPRYGVGAGYFEVMKAAIKEMHRQVGDLIINRDGLAVRGLLVRHLVLPNGLAGSEKIFQFLAKEISANTFVNIMDQYKPCYKASQFYSLNRPITFKEYQEAVNLAKKVGLIRLYLI